MPDALFVFAQMKETMQGIDDIRRYLLGKPGAREEYPFDAVILAMKVGSRIFALIATDKSPLRVNLKCAPDEAEALRAEFPAVLPGYHMNKQHWNTVILDGTIPDARIREMIDDSYSLVVAKLKKSEQEALTRNKR
jgi:predicted DNA-binding protein (MmcQ/YjbR family)